MASSLLGFSNAKILMQLNMTMERSATLHLHYYVYGKHMNIEAYIHVEDKLFCTSI